MGRFDSSKTRVAPFFDALLARDATGLSWLDALLARGSRLSVVDSLPRNLRLVPGHGRQWGSNEARLPAPRALLEHLIENIDLALAEGSPDTGETRKQRLALAHKDKAVVAAALQALRAGDRGQKWFVLEGDSRPDALLETPDIVICVEGKRTESACTTHTSWMRRRSQIVRHMDAATDAFPGKRILGLLIVEGDDNGPTAPSRFWLDQCAEQYAPAMLEDSLPHRNAEERARIGDGIVGVTTWQAACAAAGISFGNLPESV